MECSEISIKAAIYNLNGHRQVVFTLFDSKELVDLPKSKRDIERTLGLWNDTCFEFFITDNGQEYAEGNFSLDFGWNIFWFKSYRSTPLTQYAFTREKNPIRDIYLSGKKSFIVINIPDELIENFNEISLKFSLTAVIKTKSGNTHYYALKHSDEKPNFHHADSFDIFK